MKTRDAFYESDKSLPISHCLSEDKNSANSTLTLNLEEQFIERCLIHIKKLSKEVF